MKSINQIQDELIADFELFDDWMDKYEYLIEQGKNLPLIPEELKTEDRLIRGCQSRVWLNAQFKDNIMTFTADSDAVITKGLVALIIGVLSGHTPEEIAAADLYMIDRVGLKEHLSPTRSNGLVSMVNQIKLHAFEAIAKQ